MSTTEFNTINAKDKPVADDFEYVYVEIEDGGFRKVKKEILKSLLNVASKLSELKNDEGFVTKVVSDLENYYLKSETYSRDEIDNKVSLIPRFNVQVVPSLPSENISETTVYLLSSGEDTDNLYTEYINVNGLWEILGTQKIASVENVVLYTEQNLTKEQKTQARTNIGAASEEVLSSLSIALDRQFTSINLSLVKHEEDISTVQKNVADNAQSIENVKNDIPKTAEDIGARPATWMPTASEVGADESGTALEKVSKHNVSEESHSDIRLLINNLTTRLNTIANSEDVDLDQLGELVAYIKSNRSLIEEITTNKVSVADIIDNLTTSVINKPLSAKQGVVLKGLIDAIVVPTLLSQLTGDATHRLVTDEEKAIWNNKANKATTLAGYGITDGATKQEVSQLEETIADYKASGIIVVQDGSTLTINSGGDA